jgi:hypothetical protein
MVTFASVGQWRITFAHFFIVLPRFCILQVSYEKLGGSYKKLPSKTTKTLRKRFDPCRYVEEVKVIKCPQIPKRKIPGPQTDLSDAFWACSASPINKPSLHSYHASTITDTK